MHKKLAAQFLCNHSPTPGIALVRSMYSCRGMHAPVGPYSRADVLRVLHWSLRVVTLCAAATPRLPIRVIAKIYHTSCDSWEQCSVIADAEAI